MAKQITKQQTQNTWTRVQRLFDKLKAKYELDDEWNIRKSRSKNQYGRCFHYEHEITISRYHIENGDWEDIEDTVRHEVAHALVGEGHGHNKTWRKKAKELDADPTACSSKGSLPDYRYKLRCRCGRVRKTLHQLHRKTYHRKICHECYSKFKAYDSRKDKEIKLWTDNCIHIPDEWPDDLNYTRSKEKEWYTQEHDWDNESDWKYT